MIQHFVFVLFGLHKNRRFTILLFSYEFTDNLLFFSVKMVYFQSGPIKISFNYKYIFTLFVLAIDHREAVGHIFSFLSASNHTTITTTSYALFMLAQHPEVQDKLRDEVDRVMKKNKDVTMENINDMTYLDAVLNGKIIF